MITVKEMRALLEQFPEEMRVVVKGYEGGYYDAEAVSTIKLALDVNTAWYYGPHEMVGNGYVSSRVTPEHTIVEAVLI